ncbi:HAD superfamily hydrolase (TIGR01509 family) [Saccharothrix carnea]|uniref:HAD superfamily hydrolase (TIGR01509 family) n=1 Tax=Saccharothrix carnea TaxID=1280637 RepID=A0A2P8I7X4_SACCR|nr:HAD-IA family hydrolase [Saccharothrix carnea]PSL54553.1 HAD superfamily hydrolase (TIGR01509 family) [Saccharothrix carnea]
MSAPSLLLLDLDGVLRRFPPDGPIEDDFGLPRGTLARVSFALAGPATAGRATDEEWRAAVRQQLVAEGLSPARAAGAVAAWTRTGEVIGEALELVRRVRERCRVALLSNATDRLPRDLAALGLDREVDAVVSSARLGVAKPSPEAFRRALRVLQHSPSGTLFCDDNSVNTEAARTVGIDAVHTPDFPSLHEALSSRGLLDDGVGTGSAAASGPLLLVLHDRDDAEEAARELSAAGWQPCAVHKDVLAGEDDLEDADWVVELTTGPDDRPASTHRGLLEELAGRYDGFVTD